MKKMMLVGAALAALGPMTAAERGMGRYMRAPDGHPFDAAASLAAVRTQRNTLVEQMGAMLAAARDDGDRDLTAEETTAYDALATQLTSLDARITRLTGFSAAEAAGGVVVPAAARKGGPMSPPPGPGAKREFESLGEFMAAVRFNPNDQRLAFVENVGAEGGADLSAEMRMDNDTQGGFMVPTTFRSTIMSVKPQEALVRPRAQVLEPGAQPDAAESIPALDQSGTDPGHMFGGVEVQWIGEGDDKPDTGAKLRNVTLSPHEVAGTTVITDKLLRNWRGSQAFIENLLRGAVAGAEDYSFQRGNGIHKPLGILFAGATKWINRAGANQVTYVDLANMVARMLMRGGTPVWSIPQSALVQLVTMTDPEGHYIWKASSAVDAAVSGIAGTLLGYPVRWNNRSPNLGSKGDITLCDWSQYLIKDGSGPFVAASEHVLFKQNKTMIKIFWNVDGAPWLTAPIAEENGWEVSPFVGLDVPA
ncbi:phage major capsid protein [Sphingomonas koreensis]